MTSALGASLEDLKRTTETLLARMVDTDIDLVMANSVKYLELFGHVVVGWMWLRQGRAAALAMPDAESERDFYFGKLQAMKYFARWELPQTRVWAELLCSLDDSAFGAAPEWL